MHSFWEPGGLNLLPSVATIAIPPRLGGLLWISGTIYIQIWWCGKKTTSFGADHPFWGGSPNPNGASPRMVHFRVNTSIRVRLNLSWHL